MSKKKQSKSGSKSSKRKPVQKRSPQGVPNTWGEVEARINEAGLVPFAEVAKQNRERFIAKFGREPIETDPWLFDEESNTPKARSDVDEAFAMMLELLKDTSPHIAYAAKRCGFVLTAFNKDQFSKKDLAEWSAAIDEYYALADDYEDNDYEEDDEYPDTHPTISDPQAGNHGEQYFGADEAAAAGLLKPGHLEELRHAMKEAGQKLVDRVRNERAETAAREGENPAIVAAIRATGVRFPDLQYVMLQGHESNNWFITGAEGQAWVGAAKAYLADHPEVRHSFNQRIHELFIEGMEADFPARGLSVSEETRKGDDERARNKDYKPN